MSNDEAKGPSEVGSIPPPLVRREERTGGPEEGAALEPVVARQAPGSPDPTTEEATPAVVGAAATADGRTGKSLLVVAAIFVTAATAIIAVVWGGLPAPPPCEIVPPETNHSAVAKRVAGELGELATKTPVKGNLSAEAQAVLDRSFAAIPESDVVCHMVLQSVLCLANSNRAEAAHEMSAFIATKCKDSATASDATVPPTSAAASKDTGPDGGAADAAIDAPRDPPGKPPLEAQIAQKPCKTLCEKAYTSGIAQCVQIPDKASVDYRNCPKEKTSKRQSCLEGCKQ